MRVLSRERWDRALLRKGLVPTPAVPVATTPVAAITPVTRVITIIPVITVAPMIPVVPMTTVVAMAPAKTAQFEDFRDPHVVLSLIFSEAFNRPGVSRGTWRGDGACPSTLTHLRLLTAELLISKFIDDKVPGSFDHRNCFQTAAL